jgi:hypothetical protein
MPRARTLHTHILLSQMEMRQNVSVYSLADDGCAKRPDKSISGIITVDNQRNVEYLLAISDTCGGVLLVQRA